MEAPEPAPARRWILRIIVGGAVLASFGIWAYAYSGAADRPPPDELDSTRARLDAEAAGESYEELPATAAYGARGTAICEEAMAALPDARLATNGPERANQLRRANLVLEGMIEQLRGLPVATERDDELRNLWLDDWEVLVGDRNRYADAVEVDPAAVFTVSGVAENERLERRLTRFARTNLMLACGAPADLG